MIELLVKERASTSWCIECAKHCGQPEEEVCRLCQGHIATYFKCPVCNLIDHYFAHDKPDICKCGFIWPDLNLLKEEAEDRIGYHFQEDI